MGRYNNQFDATYVNSGFLKSFIVNNKVRLFVGNYDYQSGVVKKIGYDVSKNGYIEFPLTDDGFLDEIGILNMMRYDGNIGIDIDYYYKLNKDNLVILLNMLGSNGIEVVTELNRFNYLSKLK